MSMRRRIAFSTVLAALVGVLAAGLVAVGLVRTSYDSTARANLQAQGKLIAAVAGQGSVPRGFAGRKAAIQQQIKLRYVIITPERVAGTRLLPADVVTAAENGQQLSATRTLNGRRFLIDVEPIASGGGVVVFQPLSEARAVTSHVYRRLLLASLIGLLIAVVIGVTLASRLSRPLVEAARGAHRLADGERSIRLDEEGPDEVAEVSRSINRLAQALTVSEGRERDFLLSVSHELKTPLTGIRGFAEALSEGVAEPAEAGRTIEAEATRMQRLVADLLDLARAGADDFRIDLADIDLVALVRDAATVWSRRCSDVGVLFSLELPENSAFVRTDGGRVRQVLDGLAENALRVTPEGRPIVFAVRAEGPVAVLEVRDGGPGLRSEDLPVAFDRSVLYERYRGVRQVGTGLGLALVATLARRLGGSVRAGHAAEGGACFTLLLPR